MRPFVIGGNWKLQINTIEKTKAVLTEIRDAIEKEDTGNTEIFLALPYTTLYVGQEMLKDSKIALAAQNVHYDESGPYTGEISIEALKEFGVEYVLVGHSERRIIFDELESTLNKKVHKVLEHGLKIVLCIGETAAQRNSGEFEDVLAGQLSSALEGVDEDQLSSIILAYEPVWAINNPLLNPDAEIKAASPEEAQLTHAFVRGWVASNYSNRAAEDMQIQYGGSMKPANCGDLLPLEDIDGGLIGSASLSASSFLPIVQTASSQ